MTKQEMTEICDILTGAYRFMDFSGPATFGIWYETLKAYELPEVRHGVRNWIAYSKQEPTPADILDSTKNVRIAARRIAQDSVAWHDAVKCPKCNDRGYVLVIYPRGYEELRPCDCASAREQFTYCFGEEYQKRCEYEERRLKDPDTAWVTTKYKFGLKFREPNEEKRAREEWHKKRFREIRKVERSGQVLVTIEEIVR